MICVRSFRSLPVHAQRLVEFLRPRTLVPWWSRTVSGVISGSRLPA